MPIHTILKNPVNLTNAYSSSGEFKLKQGSARVYYADNGNQVLLVGVILAQKTFGNADNPPQSLKMSLEYAKKSDIGVDPEAEWQKVMFDDQNEALYQYETQPGADSRHFLLKITVDGNGFAALETNVLRLACSDTSLEYYSTIVYLNIGSAAKDFMDAHKVPIVRISKGLFDETLLTEEVYTQEDSGKLVVGQTSFGIIGDAQRHVRNYGQIATQVTPWLLKSDGQGSLELLTFTMAPGATAMMLSTDYVLSAECPEDGYACLQVKWSTITGNVIFAVKKKVGITVPVLMLDASGSMGSTLRAKCADEMLVVFESWIKMGYVNDPGADSKTIAKSRVGMMMLHQGVSNVYGRQDGPKFKVVEDYQVGDIPQNGFDAAKAALLEAVKKVTSLASNFAGLSPLGTMVKEGWDAAVASMLGDDRGALVLVTDGYENDLTRPVALLKTPGAVNPPGFQDGKFKADWLDKGHIFYVILLGGIGTNLWERWSEYSRVDDSAIVSVDELHPLLTGIIPNFSNG